MEHPVFNGGSLSLVWWLVTWAHVVANGGGPYDLRLVIAGYPREWITDGLTAGTVPSGNGKDRTRCHGLLRRGLTKSERARLAEGLPDQSGCTASIVDIDAQATAEFTAIPSERSWLIDTVDTVDGSWNVTVGVSDGYAHIGTEAISIAAGVFTRGKWDTIAQGHWVTRGDTTIASELTDIPVTMTGRRWFLYAHGPTETGLADEGTLVARGVVAAEPQERDGTWAIRLDPTVSVLDQDIVQALARPMTPMGIYYPWTAPLHITFEEGGGADNSTGGGSNVATVVMSGYWATQQEFVDELNAELVTAIDTPNLFDGLFHAEIRDGRWELVYKPGTSGGAGVYWVWVMCSNLVDGTARLLEYEHEETGTNRGYVAAGQTYRVLWDPYGTDYVRALYPPPISRADMESPSANLRSVPRSNNYDYSVEGGYPRVRATDTETAANPRKRVYLREAYLLAVGDTVTITTDNGETAAPIIRVFTVSAVDATTGAVDFSVADGWINAVWVGNAGPIVRVASDTIAAPMDLGGFRDALVADGPLRGNLGDWPLVDGDDIASWQTAVDIASEGRAPLEQRMYLFPKRISLKTVISHELRTYGLFMYTDGDEKLAVRPITPALETDSATMTITADHRIIDDGFGTVDVAADGVVNCAEMRVGFNPESGSFDGDTFIFPNAISISRNGGRKRTLEIHPRVALAPGVQWTRSDAHSVCTPPISFFGDRYHVLTMAVTLECFDLRVGDGVAVDVPQLPWNGARGIDSTGTLIGYSWDFDAGRGELEILLRDVTNVAGYTPAGRVATQVNTSGNIWALTLTANHYSPTGAVDASFFAVNDRVETAHLDTTTASMEGTVTAVSGNVVTVSFDGVFTPSGTVSIVYTDHVDVIAGTGDANQTRYAFIADSGRLLSDSSPARNFSS